ncbi:succinylglutamate desuccinylase/aspartoacylase family protein [Congregibacter sp.]|uniref:succinylglutamate desuccinylase/aspartoacylase family protein n=1 Tax=Congregibacter sp. TaxID=2744308 RepID=UPI00385E138C
MSEHKTNQDLELTLGGEVINPGFQGTIEVPVAPTYTHNDLSMTVKIVNGKRPGPKLFVSAAIHGDEINGVEIIRRLLGKPVVERLRGTLIAIPIVNVYGFLNHSRYLPDGRDLNRSFPGTPRGSLAGRVAHTFVEEVVSKCTHGIDLHTGARHRSNFPQIRADLDNVQAMAMTEAFDVPLALDSKVRDGSLRQCAGDLGIPVILYEAGESLRFDEMYIRAGVQGVVNVMRSIGMLPKSRGRRRSGELITSDETTWVRAPESGVLRVFSPLGDRVEKGQLLAMIADPLGTTETPLHSPVSGMVIGRTNLPLVYEGDAVFHIARYGRKVKAVEKGLEGFTDAHQPNDDETLDASLDDLPIV